MKKTMTSLSSLLVLSLAACGGSSSSGDAENNLSKEDSARAFDETGNRTNSAAESAQNSAAFRQAFGQLAAEVDVDAEIQCTGGGSAALEGSVSFPDEAGSTDSEMNLSVSYQTCAENGITIDGDLAYWFASSSDDSGTTTVSMTMNGAVAFTGDIEGSCGVDAAIDVTINVSEGSFDIQVDANGTFCGYDLDELNAGLTEPGAYGNG